jgi:hypothetical protein
MKVKAPPTSTRRGRATARTASLGVRALEPASGDDGALLAPDATARIEAATSRSDRTVSHRA